MDNDKCGCIKDNTQIFEAKANTNFNTQLDYCVDEFQINTNNLKSGVIRQIMAYIKSDVQALYKISIYTKKPVLNFDGRLYSESEKNIEYTIFNEFELGPNTLESIGVTLPFIAEDCKLWCLIKVSGTQSLTQGQYKIILRGLY